MSDAYIVRRGGSGTDFRVLWGAQPENPREKDIWVDTDVPVSSWALCTGTPAEPREGMVHIMTGSGDSSCAGFNALRKNALFSYPVACRQFTGGLWQLKTARSYLNGQWRDWSAYFYRDGDEYIEKTGGWQGIRASAEQGFNAGTPIINSLEDHIGYKHKPSSNTNNSSLLTTVLPVDLSLYNTLEFDVTSRLGGSQNACLLVYRGDTDRYREKAAVLYDFKNISYPERIKINLDISSCSGEYHLGVGCTSSFTDTAPEVGLYGVRCF